MDKTEQVKIGQISKLIARFAENISKIVEGIPSEIIQFWINRPTLFQAAMKEILSRPRFKTWKTIKLGTDFKTAGDLGRALDKEGYNVNVPAINILYHPDFTVTAKETSIDLVLVCGAELGFEGLVNRDSIYARAKKFGLKLCPAEVGPQLRLQYKDQSVFEQLLIGMEPIKDSEDCLQIFGVACGMQGKSLFGYNGDSDSNTRYVFCK